MPNFILPIFFVIFIFVCTAHAEDGENTGELNIESKTELYSANLYIKSEDNENFVKGRVWGCSQSVSNAVKVFKGDQEFNSFWYNYGTQILKRKEFISDFFSICKCSFSSIIFSLFYVALSTLHLHLHLPK